jgi:tetratricopeptide (TPR) repeat protein
MTKRRGFSAKLNRAVETEFIGRETYLEQFRHNSDLNPNDPAYRNIFDIFGQDGVGKSWLMRKFRSIANENRFPTALVDLEVDDVPHAMGRIAEQFEEQGHALKDFGARNRDFLEKLEEIHTDPNAPKGGALIGRVLGRVGLAAAGAGVGAAAGPLGAVGGLVLGALPEEELVSYAGEITGYLAKKFRKTDDVLLMKEPTRILTPLFLSDLMKLQTDVTPMVFFDTFERTAGFLDRWLRDVLAGVYGEMPEDMVISIAGRYELGKGPRDDPRHAGRYPWSEFHDFIARMPLEPFTEKEAREFLHNKGISDKAIVAAILEKSQHLPQFLNLLAEASPADASEVGDLSGSAVDLILQWVNDPAKREAALMGAISRTLNKDVLALLVGDAAAAEAFQWLTQQPFVEDRGPDGWAYDRLVREMMLHHQRRVSHKDWASAHEKLTKYYEKRRDDLGLDAAAGREDENWQVFDIERLYHRLSEAPSGNLKDVLQGFLFAVDAHLHYARRWSEVLTQVGKDVGDNPTQIWGEKLSTFLDADSEADYELGVETITELIDVAELDSTGQALALTWRGRLLHRSKQHERALEDMSTAVELEESDPEHWMSRGSLLHDMERYDDAISDFTRAMELDPDSARASVLRGVARFFAGQFNEAAADFDAVVEMSKDDARIYNLRAQISIRLEHYDEALADLDRAQELGFEPISGLHASRTQIYIFMGRLPEALETLELAQHADPNNVMLVSMKLAIFKQMGDFSRMASAYAELSSKKTQFMRDLRQQFKEAPAALIERDLKLWATNTGLDADQVEELISGLERIESVDDVELESILKAEHLAVKALDLGNQGKYDEALNAVDEAIGLDEQANLWFLRGLIRTEGEEMEQALDDFFKALELNDSFVPAWISRGDLYLRLKRHEEALVDYGRALELKPNQGNVLFARGSLLNLMTRHDEAIADFTQIIEEDLELRARALAMRAGIRTEQDEFASALDDLGRADAEDPGNLLIAGLRMNIYRRQGKFDLLTKTLEETEEAIASFVREYHEAVETEDESLAKGRAIEWMLRQGVPTQLVQVMVNNTLDQLEQGAERAEKLMQAELATGNADQHIALKQWEPALVALSHAIELVPEEAQPRLQRAELLRRIERYEEADAAFGEIIDMEPENAAALAGRGESFRLQAHYKDALDDFDRAIRFDPASKFAIVSRGETYFAMKRYEDAVADFDRSLELDPEYNFALWQRALAKASLELYEEALDDVERAIQGDPTNSIARLLRGELYFAFHRLDEAVIDLDYVIGEFPDSVEPRVTRGRAFYRRGEVEDALADLDRALELEPENFDARIARAEAYRLSERWDKALADIDRLEELDTGSDWSHYLRYLIHTAVGEPESAENSLDDAIAEGIEKSSEDPDNPERLLNIALYYAAKGNAQEAKDLAARVLEGTVHRVYVLEAIRDLDTLLALRPENEAAKAIRARLQARMC